MGRIYKNGINYSGGIVPASASVVSYDNTTSGLTSTNSQSAIDELARPTFTEATTLANINSAESSVTLWGKIKTFISFIGVSVPSLAGVYSPSSTYPLGSYCLYSGKLYFNTVEITVGETWNASKWSVTSILDFLISIKSGVLENGTNTTVVAGYELKKVGRVCFLNAQINTTAILSAGGVVIAKLPKGFRPMGNPYVTCRVLNNTEKMQIVQVQSGGNIITADFSNIASGAQFVIETSYVVSY